MTANPQSGPGWPRPGASIAVFRGEEILLVQRGKGAYVGLWSLPGGHIEAGEPAQIAALRELAEETGVSAEIVGLADVCDVIIHDTDGRLCAHYVLSVYAGRWRAGEPVAASDSRAARFVAIADLENYALTDGAKAVIERAQMVLDGANGRPTPKAVVE